jgi:hypothetical protein
MGGVQYTNAYYTHRKTVIFLNQSAASNNFAILMFGCNTIAIKVIYLYIMCLLFGNVVMQF